MILIFRFKVWLFYKDKRFVIFPLEDFLINFP